MQWKKKQIAPNVTVMFNDDSEARRQAALNGELLAAMTDPTLRAVLDGALGPLPTHPADHVGIHNARMLDPTLVGHCIECRQAVEGDRIFCSDACREQVAARNGTRARLIEAIFDSMAPRVLPRCEACDEPFIPVGPKQRHCVKKCQKKAEMRRLRKDGETKSSAALKREAVKRRQDVRAARATEAEARAWLGKHTEKCSCVENGEPCEEAAVQIKRWEAAGDVLEAPLQERLVDGDVPGLEAINDPRPKTKARPTALWSEKDARRHKSRK